MALFELEEIAERLSGSTGLGVGIAAAVLAPSLVPLVGRGLRPVMKGAIKSYLAVSRRTRTAVVEAGERLQDLYTEAKSEVDSGLSRARGAADSAG
jgi:hypothetical protein